MVRETSAEGWMEILEAVKGHLALISDTPDFLEKAALERRVPRQGAFTFAGAR